MIKEVEQLLKQ